jgi:hypothetical protein
MRLKANRSRSKPFETRRADEEFQMKKPGLLVLMILCLALSSAPVYPQTHAPESKKSFKPVKREPRIGDKISGYPKSKYRLMIRSAQTDPAYEVSYQGIEFLVTANDDKRISAISTRDARFKTPEGIGVGDTLEQVLKVSQNQLSREPGWAFYVYLKSGWYAAFAQGESMTEGELAPTAQVKWLFQRD